MSEEWRPVLGGDYEVSNQGRIRRAAPGTNTFPGRLLSLAANSQGYYIVGLMISGKRKTFAVHRLVGECFIGPIPQGLFVNHKDGNKLNNHVTNLEYVTPHENCLHAKEHGLLATGSRHGTKTSPGYLKYGDDHWTRKKPERLARGDRNGSRAKPERLKRGEAAPGAKLTEDDVRSIRQLADAGRSCAELARQFGVTAKNIEFIVKRKSWRHV